MALDSAATLIVGVVAFALTLAITLDLFAALVILVLFIFLSVLAQSFSRGWLFLLGMALLLPPIKLAQTELWIHNSFFIILGIVGIMAVSFGREKIWWGRTGLYFLGMILYLGLLLFISLSPQVKSSNELKILSFTVLIYFSLQIALSHFFQTQKRIKRFFLVLVVIGSLHSVFGLASFWLSWQNSLGMGVTPIKKETMIFRDVNFEINGFLSDSYYSWLGSNALAPLLLITITVTLGLIIILVEKSKQPTLFSEKKEEEEAFLAAKGVDQRAIQKSKKKQLMDSVYLTRTGVAIKKRIVDLSSKKNWKREYDESIFNSRIFLILLLLIQILALILTFSHTILIILVTGIFIMGTLLRSKSLLSFAATLIIILALIFPGFQSSLSSESEANFQSWVAGYERIKENYVLGKGLVPINEPFAPANERIFNSYLFIWENAGLIGLLLFILTLLIYFWETRAVYIRSDGWQRIWLIVVLSIFSQFILLGFTSNVLLFGPAAIVFWMLAGVVNNLKERKFVFKGWKQK
ncbi:MAG TPA: hypothetical protein GX706_02215 [Candidatus Moranbacteria bacterium]|nr:hypothetical protein [Candidatus Moranbacteria bacterium]